MTARSGCGYERVASRPYGYRSMYSECDWYSSNWRPAKKAALNMVVANWLIPPPTASSNRPNWMVPAGTNPFSVVRSPTNSLMENVSPGWITTPRTMSAMRWMFSTLLSQQLWLVVNSETISVMPSLAAWVRASSTSTSGSASVRWRPDEIASNTRSATPGAQHRVGGVPYSTSTSPSTMANVGSSPSSANSASMRSSCRWTLGWSNTGTSVAPSCSDTIQRRIRLRPDPADVLAHRHGEVRVGQGLGLGDRLIHRLRRDLWWDRGPVDRHREG